MNYELFKNMKPMKYYENDWKLPKAQEMINNKDEQFFAMRKYDGEWCRAIVMDDGVLLQSRSISRVTGEYGDKTHHVPHIVQELMNFFSPGTVLLGEIAYNDWSTTSRDVGSIMRSAPKRAIRLQEDRKLHFFVFDVLAMDGESLMDKPFQDRFKMYPEFIGGQYVAPAMSVSGPDADFMEFADYVWSKDGEGIMIVRKDMMYQPGSRRAWQTLKLKKKLGDLEVSVIDTIEPRRLYEGDSLDWEYEMDGVKVTKPYYFGWKNGVVVEYEGRIINVTSGLTDKEREWLATTEAKKIIDNKTLKGVISGMELTENSVRHPIFKHFIK